MDSTCAESSGIGSRCTLFVKRWQRSLRKQWPPAAADRSLEERENCLEGSVEIVTTDEDRTVVVRAPVCVGLLGCSSDDDRDGRGGEVEPVDVADPCELGNALEIAVRRLAV
ncbi:hypothetical protein [Natrinema halophilum]|uniref:Uncharacterized protein n=1 Tax=Natrinema halophilum TaxID=1699371 RepID=A0A7D5K656_9EURY|nr:hypothetical protein [Natrinema halophilum]QLG48963.1 hypothetical protein HYG82_08920 [Natrinema halophilum]